MPSSMSSQSPSYLHGLHFFFDGEVDLGAVGGEVGGDNIGDDDWGTGEGDLCCCCCCCGCCEGGVSGGVERLTLKVIVITAKSIMSRYMAVRKESEEGFGGRLCHQC